MTSKTVPSERDRERQRRWWTALPASKRAERAKKKKARRKANVLYYREQDRKYTLAKYGLSPEEFNRINLEQGGRCAICGKDGSENVHGHLYVDHDHDTGVVRGLLCSTCNVMIGHAQENPDLLVNGVAYLARTRHNQHASKTDSPGARQSSGSELPQIRSHEEGSPQIP